jgi:hypothetical protein
MRKNPTADLSDVMGDKRMNATLQQLQRVNPEAYKTAVGQLQVAFAQTPLERAQKAELAKWAAPGTAQQPEPEGTPAPPQSRGEAGIGKQGIGSQVLKEFYQNKPGEAPGNLAAPTSAQTTAQRYDYRPDKTDREVFQAASMGVIPFTKIYNPIKVHLPGSDVPLMAHEITGIGDRSGYYEVNTGRRLPFAEPVEGQPHLEIKPAQGKDGKYYAGVFDTHSGQFRSWARSPDGNLINEKDPTKPTTNWATFTATAANRADQIARQFNTEDLRIKNAYNGKIQAINKGLEAGTVTDKKQAATDIANLQSQMNADLSQNKNNFQARISAMKATYGAMGLADIFDRFEDKPEPAQQYAPDTIGSLLDDHQ